LAKLITVSIYVLRANVKRDTKTAVKLDRIDGNVDLFEVMKEMFADLVGKVVSSDTATRQLVISNPLAVDDVARTIDGIVEVGSSGYGSDFVDLKSRRRSFKRTPLHAEMIPLHLRLWIPKREHFGILALQNFGEVGCKTLLTEHVLSTWDEISKTTNLRFREVIPKDAYADLIGAKKITKIRLIHHGVPEDIADKYGGKALDPTLGTLELSINSKRGSELGAQKLIKKMFDRGSFATTGIIELDDFEPHEMKVEVKDKNNRKQVISFGDLIRTHSRVDVTEDVKLTEEGHPTLQSISAISKRLMIKFASELN
jgi:hypothetical protein